MTEDWVAKSEGAIDSLCQQLKQVLASSEDHVITVTYVVGKRRSGQQRKALEVFCRQVSEELNNRGLDMKRVLKAEVDIPWTQAAVKEYLWRPLQVAMLGKESTSDLERDECGKVYETLNRLFIDRKFGFHVPWPEEKNKGEENEIQERQN